MPIKNALNKNRSEFKGAYLNLKLEHLESSSVDNYRKIMIKLDKVTLKMTLFYISLVF